MCKDLYPVNSSDFPEKFLLENGKKALMNELRILKKDSERATEIKEILGTLPIVKTTEQDLFVMPGNGIKLHSKQENKGIFCVLDGTVNVKKHNLPPKVKVILASSKLGKSLIGKKKGEIIEVEEEGKLLNFEIKEIGLPSKSKWPFKFQEFLLN